jgi:uncharacterized membrane protein
MVWGMAPEGQLHWTEKLFFGLCHQLPDRTYTIDGIMMAVNTRCFGIFLGMAAGWIVLPFVARLTVGKKWPLLLLALAVSLQIVDYLGNLAELWQNTNHSRAVLGAIFGMALSVSVSDLFLTNKNKH